MLTHIPGIQVTNIQIKKECRELHGVEGAFDEAVKIAKERYLSTAQAIANSEATFNLCLTVDRDD